SYLAVRERPLSLVTALRPRRKPRFSMIVIGSGSRRDLRSRPVVSTTGKVISTRASRQGREKVQVKVWRPAHVQTSLVPPGRPSWRPGSGGRNHRLTSFIPTGTQSSLQPQSTE